MCSAVLKNNKLSGWVWFCKTTLLPSALPPTPTQKQPDMHFSRSYFRLRLSFSVLLPAASTLTACSMLDITSRRGPPKYRVAPSLKSLQKGFELSNTSSHLILLSSACTARKTCLTAFSSSSLFPARNFSLGCTRTLHVHRDKRDSLQPITRF